jgi:membrane associated rhomboid family serine protease
MFIPIGDDNRDRHLTPFVNYLLIAINIIAFIFWQDWGQDIHNMYSYAAVPGEILTGVDITTRPVIVTDPITGNDIEMPGLQVTPIPVYLTLFTSMFMHGGLAHLGGNMLFLWVFGDNLENAMGHLKYFGFYLLCGILAALTHVFSAAFLGQNLLVPVLGASGAISGILGGYILLYPGRRVHLWVLFTILSVPALIVLGIWIIFQIINGLGTLGGEESASVAYGAHIGGFVFGLLLVKFFANRVQKQQRKRSFF